MMGEMVSRSKSPRPFNAQAFLDSAGIAPKGIAYPRAASIFSQGDACSSVMYIQKGGVKLSVRSRAGRVAVVAVLGPGKFFGEGCLAGQPVRMSDATSVGPSRILVLKKEKMMRLLHQQADLADRFITHMLDTNIRIEEDLLEQLFNHDERRLARTLLLLSRYGTDSKPHRLLPRTSRQRLAKLAGITRSNVDFFMNKFERLGFIDNDGGLTVNSSLLSVVLHD